MSSEDSVLELAGESVRIIKAITGEDLIGFIDDSLKSTIRIYAPTKLVLLNTQKGFAYDLIPMPIDRLDSFVEMRRSHVIYAIKPQDKLAEQFLESIRRRLAWLNFCAQDSETQAAAVSASIEVQQTSASVH